MITVAKLREELAKFPDDALCYAYEGEVTGVIVIHPKKRLHAEQGVIFCKAGKLATREEHATHVPEWAVGLGTITKDADHKD